MSDVNPGPGWWQAIDGRWYPPELEPGQQLVRDERGATILVGGPTEVDERAAHDVVGGSIEEHTELILGRPAGQQNRPAAWGALIGALLLGVGALLPWAVRAPDTLANTSLGWRDANGQPGSAVFVALMAVTVVTIAVRCMAGSHRELWRLALLILGLGAATLAIAEALRIVEAIDEVSTLTRGRADISFGPGIPVVVLGAVVVAAAAGAYRVGSPD
ncbi:MAG: hypothetical protein ACXIVQ_06705 [Acidimicrobiales bacterium]